MLAQSLAKSRVGVLQLFLHRLEIAFAFTTVPSYLRRMECSITCQSTMISKLVSSTPNFLGSPSLLGECLSRRVTALFSEAKYVLSGLKILFDLETH